MKHAIAVPDSSLNDEKTLENKTRKIAIIARACGIFKVNEIIIYKDGKDNEQDSKLLYTVLKYLSTPQYFRRKMFPKSNLLKLLSLLLITLLSKVLNQFIKTLCISFLRYICFY